MIIKKFLLILIDFYQMLVSPILGNRCRFYPTCSQYTKQSLEFFSIPKALWYSVIRILKCHPFHPGGYDPVPELERKL